MFCIDVDQLELSNIAGGMQNGTATLENSLGVSYKIKHILLCDPESYSWMFTSQKWKLKLTQKPLHKYLQWFNSQWPKPQNNINVLQ